MSQPDEGTLNHIETIQNIEKTTSADLLHLIPNQKKHKLNDDERLSHNRERNRKHAHKTRERKRVQVLDRQSRIKELHEEGQRLRQLIDESCSIGGLLGLSQKHNSEKSSSVSASIEAAQSNPSNSRNSSSSSSLDTDHSSNNYEQFVSASAVCNNFYADVFFEGEGKKENNDGSAKRARRSGKFSQEERNTIRRERNRVHAKKTRDRKRLHSEMSERAIVEMEAEVLAMRQYLSSMDIVPEEQLHFGAQQHVQQDNSNDPSDPAHFVSINNGEQDLATTSTVDCCTFPSMQSSSNFNGTDRDSNSE